MKPEDFEGQPIKTILEIGIPGYYQADLYIFIAEEGGGKLFPMIFDIDRNMLIEFATEIRTKLESTTEGEILRSLKRIENKLGI